MDVNLGTLYLHTVDPLDRVVFTFIKGDVCIDLQVKLMLVVLILALLRQLACLPI